MIKEHYDKFNNKLKEFNIAHDDVLYNQIMENTGKDISELTDKDLALMEKFIDENYFIFTKTSSIKTPLKGNLDYTEDFLSRARKIIEERKSKRERNRQKSG